METLEGKYSTAGLRFNAGKQAGARSHQCALRGAGAAGWPIAASHEAALIMKPHR